MSQGLPIVSADITDTWVIHILNASSIITDLYSQTTACEQMWGKSYIFFFSLSRGRIMMLKSYSSSSTLDLRASLSWYGTISIHFQTRLDSWDFYFHEHAIIDMEFLQVEYIWKGRKKSICKCGLHCIIVRCLTDRLFSHLPFPLCACHANFIHLPSPGLNNSFIRPHRRIVILRLWGSLLTSTVCRCYPTNPLFLSVSSDTRIQHICLQFGQLT